MSGEKKNNVDVQRQYETAGRFGAPDADREANSDGDKNASSRSKWGCRPSNRADEQSKHAAEALDEEAVQPPEVVYGKDVALDMAGYHNAEATGDELDEVGKTPDQGLSSPQPGRESSRPLPSSSSPPSISHLPLLDSKRPYV
ncbi:hypothetical protein FRC05_009144 [Tulasnella sp. 425]|nr:hypothetical protein FRC05_009144 [Tulasnella sp. 425]